MPTGLTRTAGWEIGASRTVARSLPEVWEFLTSPAGTAIWLGPGAILPTAKGGRYRTADGTSGEVRSYRPLDRVRITWQPPSAMGESTVQVAVHGNDRKTSIRFHQERLAGTVERERQRAYWKDVLDRLAAALVG